MIDNFSMLIPLLKFDSDDDFYYLQILQRRKDNPESNIKNTHVIKNYYIRNVQYLIDKKKEIIDLCNFFNARAYLRLNKRSMKKVAFRTLNNITAQMMQEDFHSARNAYDNACGQCHNDSVKKWIIDIDRGDKNDFWLSLTVEYVSEALESIRPLSTGVGQTKEIVRVLTPNGAHLITTSFDMQEFKKKFPDIDVHKDNPTILYAPSKKE